jgi:DNA-binding NarL/FixJ family response regulator
MKPQPYPASEPSAIKDKPNLRLVNAQVNRKRNSKRISNDSLFSLRINEHKLKDLVRNSVRSILIEEFGVIPYNENNQDKNQSSVVNEGSPILMLNNYRPLTAKENEVMDLVLLSFTNRKIGVRLKLRLNTVKNHMKNIISKLGVHDRIEASNVYRKLYHKPEMLSK